MSFNIACSAGAKVVVEGEALSLSGLHRAIDLCNEYSAHVPITIAIHTSESDPKNLIRYIPVADFRFTEDYRHAALIDYDLEDDDEEDIDEEEDEEEEDDDEEEKYTLRHKKIVFNLNLF